MFRPLSSTMNSDGNRRNCCSIRFNQAYNGKFLTIERPSLVKVVQEPSSSGICEKIVPSNKASTEKQVQKINTEQLRSESESGSIGLTGAARRLSARAAERECKRKEKKDALVCCPTKMSSLCTA